MLEVKKETLPKSKVKLTVSVPPALMQGFFTSVYEKLSKNIEVKGFRPGKAPKNLTVMQIGEGRLNEEILNTALQETYGQALKQEKILPVAPPKINITKMADLTSDTATLEYVAEIDLMPVVTLGDYKKIRIKTSKVKEYKVSKDELDQVLSHLKRQHASFKDIERAAKYDDRMEIDFEGFDRGVRLDNFSSKNYPIILGSKSLLPEFEEKLIGLKKGDARDFEVEVKASGKILTDAKKGEDEKKKIKFKVNVLTLQEVQMPEENDEFAKKFEKNTMDELKKAITSDIIKQKGIAENQKQENELMDELLKISKVEIPDSLVEQELNQMIERMKTQTTGMGLPFEKYLEQIRKNEEELRKDMSAQAEKTVKIGLILGEIGKQEKIDLKDKESVKKIIEKIFSYMGK